MHVKHVSLVHTLCSKDQRNVKFAPRELSVIRLSYRIAFHVKQVLIHLKELQHVFRVLWVHIVQVDGEIVCLVLQAVSVM